jgi:chromosome segregation ATPase
VGVFPYTEGYARTLRFSRSGSLLVMGGGRGGKFGHVVVWDVKSGRRITEVGKEMDCVMSADITPDHSKIVLGSTGKKVKVYDTATGEELYVIAKHTEWVLGTAFSPDGVLLATADRNGNVYVWEAANGGEFLILGQHKGPVTDLAWRSDSNLLASCSDDGTVILWEMNEGKQVKSWSAHGAGVESVSFAPDGKITSCGRDGQVKLWDSNGNKLAESPGQGDIVTKVVALSDGKSCVSANWRGEMKVLSLDKFTELGTLSSNPSQIAQRIVEAERRIVELTAAVPAAEGEVKKAEEAVKAREAQVAAKKKEFADATARAGKLEADLKAAPARLAELDKQLKDQQARRQAQVDVIKKHEQATAQVKPEEEALKKLDAELATLTAEVAKFTKPEQAPQKAAAEKAAGEKKTQADAKRSKLAGLKQSIATAPKPLAEFDKAIKDAQGAIATLNDLKAKGPKDLENQKKSFEVFTKDVAALEKQLAETKAAVPAAQQKLQATKDRLAYFQKQPTFLKAAQFNTNVLAEKEKLVKLETEFADLQGGLKDAEEAKAAALKRIEDTKKIIADSTAAVPALEAEAARLKGELPAVESIVTPSKQQEGQVASQADTQKQALAAKEAELKGLEQEKANRTAAAQKAVADINKALEALNKQRNDVANKLTGPQKISDTKKTEFTKVDGELKAAQQKHAAAMQAVQTTTNDQKAKDAALAAADKAPGDKAAAVAAAKTAHEAAKKAATDAQNALTAATAAVKKAEEVMRARRGEWENAEKGAAPLRTQLGNIDNQIAAQKKTLAEKQAEPANADKDFAAKAQPVQAAIAATKTALEPLEKQLAEIRAKLAADTKVIEAKRAEVAKAQADAGAARKRITDGQKAIETSTAEIAEKEKAITETNAEIAKLEPQLPPMREKVKKLNDQYLAMLPK